VRQNEYALRAVGKNDYMRRKMRSPKSAVAGKKKVGLNFVGFAIHPTRRHGINGIGASI